MQPQEAELLQQYLQKHFTQAQIDTLLDKPLTGPRGLRRQLGELDLEYFAQAYFPHFITKSLPDFHRQGYKELQEIADNPGGHKRAEAAPRGYAKSTRTSLIFPMYCALYKRKHYIFLLSDTAGQASGFLETIQEELESNDRIREDFGDLVGEPWKSSECVLKTSVKFESAGSGQKIRGRRHGPWRPDLIILDDLENDENTATPEQRAKLRNWFTKVVLKLGDTYTDFVYVGTVIHYDSLFSWVLNNPIWKTVIYRAVISFAYRNDLWDEWTNIITDLGNEKRLDDARAFFNNHHGEMLAGTKTLWSEKQDYYALMVVKVTEGEASFNSELQNEPINPEDRLFNCQYYDDIPPRDELYVVGAVDPSMGKSNTADFTAIITLGRHIETGFMYNLDPIIKRMHPDKIIEAIFEQHGRWQYDEFGVETVQFQQFFKDEIAKRSAKAGIYLNLVEIKSTKNKELRIQSLQPDVNNGYIKFHKSQRLLVEQLENWPKAAKDDGPDALEMARSLCVKGSTVVGFSVMSEYGSNQENEIMSVV